MQHRAPPRLRAAACRRDKAALCRRAGPGEEESARPAPSGVPSKRLGEPAPDASEQMDAGREAPAGSRPLSIDERAARLPSRWLSGPSAYSHGVGSSRHSNTPGGRAATDRVSAARSASRTTTFRFARAGHDLTQGWPRRHPSRCSSFSTRGERAADRVQGRRLAGRRRCRPAPATGPAAPTMTASRSAFTPAPQRPATAAQHGLRHVIDRGAGAAGGIAHPLRATAGARHRGERRARRGGRPPAGSGRARATLPGLGQKPVWPSRGPARPALSICGAVVDLMGHGADPRSLSFGISRTTTLLRTVKPKEVQGACPTAHEYCLAHRRRAQVISRPGRIHHEVASPRSTLLAKC